MPWWLWLFPQVEIQMHVHTHLPFWYQFASVKCIRRTRTRTWGRNELDKNWHTPYGTGPEGIPGTGHEGKPGEYLIAAEGPKIIPGISKRSQNTNESES